MSDLPPGVGLLERSSELDHIAASADEALRGEGRLLAISGEAGAGKTVLVRAACDRLSAVRVLRGTCDPLSTPRPLGPVRDLFRSPDDPFQRDIAADLPLTAVCEAVFDALRTESTVVVVDDAQWIDDASVEVLRFALRRISAMPVLILITFREGEIGTGHPLRALLGDLARAERASTIQLRPLSQASIEMLIAGTALDPAAVRRVTGGNPFFVTEIARHPDEAIPSSIRDAVLASAAELSESDLELLQLFASAPEGIDDRMLVGLAIDLPAMRRLEATGLLARSSRGIAFRHELARLAIAESAPLGAHARFHARLLAALESSGPRDAAVLTHHARAAADRSKTALYAELAATEAIRSGAHLDAVSFLTVAIDHFDGSTSERATLLERLSFEQYMVNRLDEAIDSVSQAMALRLESQDQAGVAGAHSRRALVLYYAARRSEAEFHTRMAAEIGTASGADLTVGGAGALSALLALRRNDLPEAIAATATAREVANRVGDALLRQQSDILGSIAGVIAAGDAERGSLVEHINGAVASSFDELASMGFTNLATLDIEQRRFRQADEVLDRSLPFAIERDINVCIATQTGVRSRLKFLRGRWQAALEDARAVIDTNGAPVALFWPHLVVGLLGMRRGEFNGGLDCASQLAESLDEPLLHLSLLAALAEEAWLTGTADPRLGHAPFVLAEYSSRPGLEWSLGELAVWLDRSGVAIDRSTPVAEPYRAELDGRYREAAAWWRRAGSPFDEAMALLRSDEPDDQAAAIEAFDAMGASATADRARRELRRRGITSLPSRPRAATLSNPAGLTNRQLDVARLVARGLTNAELAQQLYISAKTADHHVSAVLGKLGLATRREVMRRAAEFGLD